jgi:hypothetical protein
MRDLAHQSQINPIAGGFPMDEKKSFLVDLAETIDRHLPRRSAPQGGPAPSQPGRLGRILRWFVPNGGTLLLVVALIATAQAWAKPLASPANAPGPSATTVNYQGRLADPAGNPKDGVFGMTFALYDAPTGGSLAWGPESHAAVPVSEGLFSVGLGSQTSGGIPTSAWNGDRYLEITVGGETLSPRELIRSVPIAGMALTVPDGAISGEKLASAFGNSAQPLLNFVSRTSLEPDLQLTNVVNWTTWNLRPIVGDSAVAVVIYVRATGNTSGVYVGLQGDRTGQRVVMASGYHGGIYKGYGEITILCTPDQTIEYRLQDGSSVSAQFYVVGWYEPVN